MGPLYKEPAPATTAREKRPRASPGTTRAFRSRFLAKKSAPDRMVWRANRTAARFARRLRMELVLTGLAPVAACRPELAAEAAVPGQAAARRATS